MSLCVLSSEITLATKCNSGSENILWCNRELNPLTFRGKRLSKDHQDIYRSDMTIGSKLPPTPERIFSNFY